MSTDGQHNEAERWLRTAREDLGACHALFAAGKHSHACFLAQQCAEKAMKALWLLTGEESWGHSVQKLVEQLPAEAIRAAFVPLRSAAAALDKYYIPTRYPNGLPDLTPAQCYFAQDATAAIEHATVILEAVEGRFH